MGRVCLALCKFALNTQPTCSRFGLGSYQPTIGYEPIAGSVKLSTLMLMSLPCIVSLDPGWYYLSMELYLEQVYK